MHKEINDTKVFLITIDALRCDHLKSYGYFRNTAPNLEKYVKRGTIFENAISNGAETPSSFSSIFTSILPFLDGGYSPLPKQKIIFPQILKENGIFTYGIHSNPNLGRFFNYDRGFNVFLDGERYKTNTKKITNSSFKKTFSFYVKKILNPKNLIKKSIYRLVVFNNIKNWLRKKIPILTDILLPFAPIAYNAPYILNKVISFLKDFRGPLFLWAHFMDIHSPYNPPKKNILKFNEKDIDPNERNLINNRIVSNPHNFDITSDLLNKIQILYDAEINYVDEFLDKLLNFITSRYKKNCLIIITADHGESFYEHFFFHHQGNIFDELLKIPLFIIEIGKNDNVKRIKKTVQLLDLPSTILDFFGIKIPDYFQGKSVLPLIKGKNFTEEKYIISECYQKNGKFKRNNKEGYKLISVRTNQWKYIFDEEKNQEYLFNLEIDFKETKNLIYENITKLNEFRKIKENHLQKIKLSDEKSKIVKVINALDLSSL